MAKWTEHFKKWQVPFVGPMTRSGTTGAEIYFNDPDGNHLEIHCSNVPKRNASKFRSVLTTKVNACTNKNGRPRN